MIESHQQALEDGVLRGLSEKEPAMCRRRQRLCFRKGRRQAHRLLGERDLGQFKGRKDRGWV